jgi:molybdopterin converting factor subunit 1
MRVRVKLFAVARELAGRGELELAVPDGATVAQVRQALVAAVPALGAVLPHALLAIDARYAGDASIVTEQSELAVIPPVSGG